ncbi:hypothetical protein HDU97_005577 [Phlyctochytrium planicorne]|nr:hypothetical protein HDU97_005577 [Phlyctochytrium planicorne]
MSPEQNPLNLTPSIHLLGQWYWPQRAHRTRELVRVLAKNVNNTHIHQIHLIQPISRDLNVSSQNSIQSYFARLIEIDPFFPATLFYQKLRLSQTSHQGRLLASEAFKLASKTIPRGQIAILANQDIYFDASLNLILSSPDSDLSSYVSYFLSRYEESPRAEKRSSIGTQCGPKFVGSHDAIIFVTPLPAKLIENSRFELGSWGIEARLLWEFEQFGIHGRNPCEDIKIWHVHMGGIKDVEVLAGDADAVAQLKEKPRVMPEVNVDGKSSIAFPDRLKSKFKKVVDELWGMGVVPDKKE